VLRVTASLLGVDGAEYGEKARLVRAVAARLRAGSGLLDLLRQACTTDLSRRFLAELVLVGRIPFDDLSPAVLRTYATVDGVCTPDDGCLVLRGLGLVFLGARKETVAAYVPEDLRRPYAEAVSALLRERPGADTERLVRELEAFVARTAPTEHSPSSVRATPRARARLATPGPDRVLDLEVRLFDLPVVVRRRILVSYRRPLGALREILHVVFDWRLRGRHWFCHFPSRRLWGPAGRRVGDQACEDEWKTPLRDVLSTRGSRLLYVIDPPTHWPHEIVLTSVHAPELVPSEPRLVEAEGARPPVDYQNPSGYGDFLDAWRRDRRDPHVLAIAGPDFDPDAAIDVEGMNRRLSTFA
jgi:hypothetical protein